jgi:hypothetical protein
MVECQHCLETKSVSEFAPSHLAARRCRPCNTKQVKAYRHENPDVIRQYNRDYKKRNPDMYRNSILKTKFGITLEQYEEILDGQNGVCAICEREEDGFLHGVRKNLAVDHCHGTGEVRGLLCSRCNGAIGHFREEVGILEKAILYLKKGHV